METPYPCLMTRYLMLRNGKIVRCGQMTNDEISKQLQRQRRVAQQMRLSDPDIEHVIYAVWRKDRFGVVDEIRFMAEPVSDKQLGQLKKYLDIEAV